MALQPNLDYAAELAPHEFGRLPTCALLHESRKPCSKQEQPPAEREGWLVIGLALFRNELI